MFEIFTNIQKIPYLKNRFLTATLSIDGYRGDGPIIAKKDGKAYFISRHLDRAHVAELQKMNLMPGGSEPVFYKQYFGFVPITPPAQKDIFAAFRYVAGEDKQVKIHQDLPMSTYELLKPEFQMFLEEPANLPLVYLYKVPRKLVIERFAESREAAMAAAKRLIAGSVDETVLSEYMDHTKDNRFELLDELMTENGVECMFFTSPLGVQEVTGMGIDDYTDDEAAALYVAGSDTVYFLSARFLDGFGEEEVIGDLRTLLTEIIGKKSVGIEELHFSYGWFTYFGLKDKKWIKAQAIARNCRLKRGAYNLPYYVIVNKIAGYAMDKAIAWTKDRVLSGTPITEIDASQKMDDCVIEFCKEHQILFTVDKYWTNAHASDRCITPSYAFHHPVTQESMAFKFDAGLLLKDSKGILLAATDIARTICFNSVADRMYIILEEVVQKMIDEICDGQTGEEIYIKTVDELEKYRTELEKTDMIPSEYIGDAFPRDVGHGMTLHEPGTLWFEKGSQVKVREGMMCAHEIQWTACGYSVGYEDNFFVAADSSINLSRA